MAQLDLEALSSGTDEDSTLERAAVVIKKVIMSYFE